MCASPDMRVYSTDLRSVQTGRSQRETAQVFGIGISSVKHYLQQQHQRGTLAPKPIPGAERHIGPEQEEALRAQLKAHPNATLEQHCAWWVEDHGQQVSVATMSRALARLRWTHKKVARSQRTGRSRPQGLVRGDEPVGRPAIGLCG